MRYLQLIRNNFEIEEGKVQAVGFGVQALAQDIVGNGRDLDGEFGEVLLIVRWACITRQKGREYCLRSRGG
jgi:hypothetical protein